MFLLLNQDGNHEVTADEFCTLASVADAEDETFKYELQAATAIGGDQAVQALIAVATDACPGVDFDPLSLLEFQSASVLYYCDNDPSAFNFFVNRGASVPVDGLCESRR